MSVSSKIQEITAQLPISTRLVAVSKYHPAEAIEEAYAVGQRVFGESKVQELVQKEAQLPKDIEWHFIGHLQTNKVKQIVPFISLIHSVDSEKLLEEIDKQASKCGKTINCLLEIHVAQEETKYGFSFDEAQQLLENNPSEKYPNLSIIGIMGMSSITDDETQIDREFASLAHFYNKMKQTCAPQFKELSMGMSGDYTIAIKNGSTLIRIGTTIFGERDYSK